jgi:acyl carrier protein
LGLDIVELVMEVEDAFGIDIPDEKASCVETAGQLYGLTLESIHAASLINKNRFCRKCNYNLHGLRNPRCPECGASFVQYDDADPDVVWEILVGVICEQLGVKPERVKPELHFFKDLNLD